MEKLSYKTRLDKKIKNFGSGKKYKNSISSKFAPTVITDSMPQPDHYITLGLDWSNGQVHEDALLQVFRNNIKILKKETTYSDQNELIFNHAVDCLKQQKARFNKIKSLKSKNGDAQIILNHQHYFYKHLMEIFSEASHLNNHSKEFEKIFIRCDLGKTDGKSIVKNIQKNQKIRIKRPKNLNEVGFFGGLFELFLMLPTGGKAFITGALLALVLAFLNLIGALDLESDGSGNHSNYSECMSYYKKGAFKKPLEERLSFCMNLYRERN